MRTRLWRATLSASTRLEVPAMSIARRHPIATYLAVMYVLAALIYAPPFLGTDGLGILPVAIPVSLFLLISTIALAAVAFAVTAAADGR